MWSVVTTETKETPATSQLEVLSQNGDVTTALTVEGVVDQIAVDPGDPRGVYLRLYKSASPMAAACTAARTLRLRHAVPTVARPQSKDCWAVQQT